MIVVAEKEIGELQKDFEGCHREPANAKERIKELEEEVENRDKDNEKLRDSRAEVERLRKVWTYAQAAAQRFITLTFCRCGKARSITQGKLSWRDQ